MSAVKPGPVRLEWPAPSVSSTRRTSPGRPTRVSPEAVISTSPDTTIASRRWASGCSGCPPPAGARTKNAAEAGIGADTLSSPGPGSSGESDISRSSKRARPSSSEKRRR